jgi:hypothetical protein
MVDVGGVDEVIAVTAETRTGILKRYPEDVRSVA